MYYVFIIWFILEQIQRTFAGNPYFKLFQVVSFGYDGMVCESDFVFSML